MIKCFLLISTLLLNLNLLSNVNSWDFESTEDSNSSYVFSNNFDNFFSIYCDDIESEVYFLMNLKKEIFNEELDIVNIYFNNDRTVLDY